jgi:hypothetical protein
MLFDTNVLAAAQRYAFDTLTDPKKFVKGLPESQRELYKTLPTQITCPAIIQQELAFVNSNAQYKFEFGSNAVTAAAGMQVTPQLNNITLGRNDTFAMYGIQFFIGTQSTTPAGSIVGRIYTTRPVLATQGSLYTGSMSMKIESNTPVANISMMNFLETGNAQQYDMTQGQGLLLINPQRILTGQISTLQVIVDLEPINAMATIGTNVVISCRIHGALGQA